MAGLWDRPLVLGGDFNIIRFSNERRRCPINQAMKDFSDWILLHELVDLPLGGAEFTWSNNQEELSMSQLDRFLESTEWLDLFSDCVQNVLSRPTSDHCPIYLEFDLEDWGPPCWLETMWLKENSFIQSVPEWWNDVVINGWMGFQLVQKLKFVKKKKK